MGGLGRRPLTSAMSEIVKQRIPHPYASLVPSPIARRHCSKTTYLGCVLILPGYQVDLGWVRDATRVKKSSGVLPM